MGPGNRPNAAEALEPENDGELYNCGAFGTENPDSLVSTLWFMKFVITLIYEYSPIWTEGFT
jgi:hypothetical protein